MIRETAVLPKINKMACELMALGALPGFKGWWRVAFGRQCGKLDKA
jgi:hypothetical protein